MLRNSFEIRNLSISKICFSLIVKGNKGEITKEDLFERDKTDLSNHLESLLNAEWEKSMRR